jgi:molybdate transport system regulatory protein
MSRQALAAQVTLKHGPAAQAGAERMRLLEMIRSAGSISAAAKALGYSYKGAWDAVQALNNLFEQPLVTTRAGGAHGGVATVTAHGDAVIEAFHAIEAELERALAGLERRLEASEPRSPLALMWRLSMRTSARNALRGVVERIEMGQVNAEVILAMPGGQSLVAVITRESVADLDLAPGREAIALVKSSFVILAAADGIRTSARNVLKGRVIHRDDGAINSEISLELAPGKTLTATITRQSADALGLTVGAMAQALVKASHVILAVE